MDPRPSRVSRRGTTDAGFVEGGTMFEHSLIDLESKPRPRRWISLPIAVALHLVGLTTFALASYWNVGAVPEPKTNVVFLSFAPLPEPPGGGGQRPTVKPPVTDEVKPRTPEQPVQPTDETVPDRPPEPATTIPVDNVLPTTGTGDDNPFPGDGPPCEGCPPGPGIGPGPGGPGVGPSGDDGPADLPPIHITVGMTRPEVVHQVQPRYTELARHSGTQGTVIVEAIIDEKGYVTNVRVLRGLPIGLDQAAVEAIKQWRFKPATLADRPVKVYYTLTVNFTIQH
jgi:protein TonB